MDKDAKILYDFLKNNENSTGGERNFYKKYLKYKKKYLNLNKN